MKYTIPKGTFDLLPKDPSPDGVWREISFWQHVEETIRQVSKVYGFEEIRTPVFERQELFVRGVGESSDIVTKEMYTFEDKAKRLMALRPEGTASVMRAFVEKRLDQFGHKQKLFYIAPMFRYERPQAGRYRQHHQFGVEAVGDGSPCQDVEIIDLLLEFYRRLGLKNLTVMLNSVGDASCREKYRTALRAFLEPKKARLSDESQVRFEKNVLRILDSKDAADQKLLEGAPTILEFLSDEAKTHFEEVQKLLKQLKIPYVVEPNLVRGLDYYTKTVFEVTAGELGAQNAIGAGGRYDGLIRLLGGPDLPAIGFACGLERVIQTMLGQGVQFPEKATPKIYFIPIGETAKRLCLDLVFRFRHNNLFAEIDWNPKKVGTSLSDAGKKGAHYALVMGDDEITSNLVKLKELKTRKEITLSLSELEEFLLSGAE